jgi:peptide-methionine (S)-S-oxide reductase
VGRDYPSVIFYHNGEQPRLAEHAKEVLKKSSTHHANNVTEITPASTFWRAEKYHQQYLKKLGLAACPL